MGLETVVVVGQAVPYRTKKCTRFHRVGRTRRERTLGGARRSGPPDTVGEPAERHPGLLGHLLVKVSGLPLALLGVCKAQPGHGQRGTARTRRLVQAERGLLRALTGHAPSLLRRPAPRNELITAFGASREQSMSESGGGCTVAGAARVLGKMRFVV